MKVVICGGGVIGTSIAYRLASRDAQVTVVERCGVACAASGKSGGFLALDWCDGTPLMQLARHSFQLHSELAEELDADWGYRRLTTLGGAVRRRGAPMAAASAPGWLSADVQLGGRLGSPETTAQVHPGAFTAAMMRAAEEHGAELRIGEVTDVLRDADGAVTGVRVDGEVIEADAVVIAMGPWSILAARWLSLPPIYGLKGHSLIFDTGERVPAEALFLEYEEDTGSTLSPEVFSRADGTTYVCAISSETPLPVDPAQVGPDDGAIDRLTALCARLSPKLASSAILARQACYRPVTRDGLPLIGAAKNAPGAFVATGHSVWGILNAPATGEAMAELILDRRTKAVDLTPFDPARLRPHDPGRLVTPIAGV